MDLNSILISEFAKITNDNKETINEGTTVYGTYRVDGDGAYVQIDGSDTRTPVATTSEARNGDRVTVLIKNHRAIITGNLTDPSASGKTVENLSEVIGNIPGFIDEASKVATNYMEFKDEDLSTGFKGGLIVGNMTDETLGSNVLIHAQGIDIRNGDAVLAQYTDDTIFLGYGNTSTVIDFCHGLGQITSDSRDDGKLAMELTSSSEMVIGIIHSGYGTFPRIQMYEGASGVLNAIHLAAEYISLRELVDVEGDLTVTGIINGITTGNADINHTHSEYADIYHTHSQYYESGDNINVGRITSSYTYSDTVDYSTNMYIGTSGILHRTTKTSSREVKHDIKPIENTDILPEKLYDVDVIQFIYNEGQLGHSSKRYGKELPGFIVEDLVEKYPIAVDIDEEGKPFQWNEQYLIPPMLALIQQHKKKLDELESRIEVLEKKEV